jgi:hypothetical protein
VDHIEGTTGDQGALQRDPLRPAACGPAEVVDGRAVQAIRRRHGQVAQRERMDVVHTREPLDQGEENRDHLLAPARVEAAGHDERDLHGAEAARRLARRLA